MAMKQFSSDNYTSQRWDDIHFPQFESCGSNLASQSCQVVLVCVGYLFVQSMLSQSLKPFIKEPEPEKVPSQT